MATIISEFSLWLYMRGCRQATVDHYLQYIRLTFEHGRYSLLDFTSRDKLWKGYEHIFARDISNNSKKKYLITMRIFADFLIHKGLVDMNYPREFKAPKIQQALPFAMDTACFTRVYDAIRNRWGDGPIALRNRCIFDTIIYTGIRRTELTQIKKADISLQKIIIREGKGGKPRTIYLPEHFGAQILAYMDSIEGDYLFPSHRGDPLTGSGISIIFQNIAKLTGFRIYPHLLRHTYASQSIIAGVDIYTLQMQMGHADMRITSNYLYLNDREREKQAQKLHFF